MTAGSGGNISVFAENTAAVLDRTADVYREFQRFGDVDVYVRPEVVAAVIRIVVHALVLGVVEQTFLLQVTDRCKVLKAVAAARDVDVELVLGRYAAELFVEPVVAPVVESGAVVQRGFLFGCQVHRIDLVGGIIPVGLEFPQFVFVEKILVFRNVPVVGNSFVTQQRVTIGVEHFEFRR